MTHIATCYECDGEFKTSEAPSAYYTCEACARKLQAEYEEREAEDNAGEWRAELRGCCYHDDEE